MANQPFPIEDLLASVVEVLKAKGDARAMAIVVEGESRLEWWNSDFGTDSWRIFISLPIHVYFAMNEDERKATQATLNDAVSPFFSFSPHDMLDEVVIIPRVAEAKEGWREEAMRFIKGEGVTNQGRVRSDNIAAKQHTGLLFRSKAEITLFEAMTKARLAVAPLPVFVRIGKAYNRLEPDFIVIHKGLTFVVEVDGDTFHRETPAEADKRLVPLTHEGVEVRRIRASDLDSAAAAEVVVRDLIEFMDKRKASR